MKGMGFLQKGRIFWHPFIDPLSPQFALLSYDIHLSPNDRPIINTSSPHCRPIIKPCITSICRSMITFHHLLTSSYRRIFVFRQLFDIHFAAAAKSSPSKGSRNHPQRQPIRGEQPSFSGGTENWFYCFASSATSAASSVVHKVYLITALPFQIAARLNVPKRIDGKWSFCSGTSPGSSFGAFGLVNTLS